MIEYKNSGHKPTKTGFGEGLAEIGQTNEKVVGIGTDITTSVGMNIFVEQFPERFFSLGIAEQNAVGVAAGLALSGKIPVFATYAVFSALRTTDQIRISVCYNNLHVIICGAHAGISVGPDGATHQALEDMAIMRALPNITVLSPCDANQTHLAIKAAISHCKGPVYLRFGREAVPNFSSLDLPFEIGKAQHLMVGDDLTIIATGHLVWHAIEASYLLMQEGISVNLINMHTIKPIDAKCIIDAAKKTACILTAEEHQVTGGLGSAVAEVIVKHYPVPMDFIGMNDCFGESGKPEELMNKYGLNTKNIVLKAKELILKK